MDTTVVELKLVLPGEWELHEGAVDLGWRRLVVGPSSCNLLEIWVVA